MFEIVNESSAGPVIKVIGVGGAGGNAVDHMIEKGVGKVEFYAVNTDAQVLARNKARNQIQLGTSGLGAGAKPEEARAVAIAERERLEEAIAGSHMVFITAGMGGGTGTGAAPVISRASREEGILTVGVVTKPFHFEGQRRMRAAELGILELQKYVDTLLVIPNQNLFRVANEKTTFADAFAMADDVLRAGVSCITDLMVKEGLINLDFADVRTIMAGMGKAMMGTGESSGEKRAIEAAEAAISNPLLDDVSMKGASGLLVSITGGNDLTLYEVDEAASRIREEADPDANIIVGATFDDELDGSIRVSVVATGLGLLLTEEIKEPEEKRTLSDRLASLSPVPSAPVPHPAAPRVVRPAAEDAGGAPVWSAPGNVTIERRQPQLAVAMAQGAAPQAAEPVKAFVPTAPSLAPRPVRRMPNIEEFPIPAQNEVRARSGEVAPQGLQAQKKKVGFLERLAGVARSKKEEGSPVPAEKQEPDFGQPKTVPMPLRPVGAAPKGLRIERPSGEATVNALAKRIEAQARPVSHDAGAESQADDDLEIPAFLRRRAT